MNAPILCMNGDQGVGGRDLYSRKYLTRTSKRSNFKTLYNTILLFGHIELETNVLKKIFAVENRLLVITYTG